MEYDCLLIFYNKTIKPRYNKHFVSSLNYSTIQDRKWKTTTVIRFTYICECSTFPSQVLNIRLKNANNQQETFHQTHSKILCGYYFCLLQFEFSHSLKLYSLLYPFDRSIYRTTPDFPWFYNSDGFLLLLDLIFFAYMHIKHMVVRTQAHLAFAILYTNNVQSETNERNSSKQNENERKLPGIRHQQQRRRRRQQRLVYFYLCR